MLTITVGVGKDYNLQTIKEIAQVGNSNSEWLKLFKSDEKDSELILKMGVKKFSLVVEARNPSDLV